MSGDPTRGITCPDMRRVVREALHGGWEWVRWTGTTHAEIRWPATGHILRFGSTPSVASWKSLATDIRNESGIEVWRKGNRKRSRKADQLSGFSIQRAHGEATRWHETWDRQIERLASERDHLIAECRASAASGKRERICLLADALRRIAEIEDELVGTFHQPVDRFDPYTLARLE